MFTGTANPILSDPIFQDALSKFQSGDWDSGLNLLDSLAEQNPGMTQLRDFRQEMVVRSQVDAYEKSEKIRNIARKFVFYTSRLIAVVVVLGLFIWGVNSYSTWLQTQWNSVTQVVMQEVQTFDTSVKFRNAQNYLSAGRPADALLILGELEAQEPNYPGLSELLDETSQKLEFEEQYNAAQALLEDGDLVAALSAFQAIQSEQPGYKDVQILVHEIERKLILDELYLQAESAYNQAEWEDAIMRYESLRAESPDYKPAQIEESLIDSYINAAVLALDDDSPTSDALLLADEYFRAALELRPIDREILAAQNQAMETFKERLFTSYLERARETLYDNEDSLAAIATANKFYDLALGLKPGNQEVILERQLASSYLIAQQSFLDSDWDTVVDNLEVVIQSDKRYANGIAQQTLYEAYMKRGRKLLTNGEYESAIEDYQRAAEIADESPEAKINVYWSLIEMADVHGILGEYQKADSLYNHAVEWIGLRDILQEDRPDLVLLLDEADRYAGIEWFRTSYRLYNRVLPAEEWIYSAVYHDVAEGDYLTQIASKYRTTVEAILSANEFANPGELKTGQRILVPVLSGDDD